MAHSGAVRAVVVGLALVLTACATAGTGAHTEPRGETEPGGGTGPRAEAVHLSAGKPGRAAVRAASDVPVRPARDSPDPPRPAPTRVEVPALGVSVRIRATGVDEAGRMALPASADVAGWYRFGPAPASREGATVVAAHVDDEDSVGPFARLAEVRIGTEVRVRTSDGSTYNYTVTDNRAEAKRDVSADDVFDRSGDPRLVLVTCGGEWDPVARSYTENVVVTAVPRR